MQGQVGLCIAVLLPYTRNFAPQVYKWVPVTHCWGQPCDGLASHPGGGGGGGGSNTPIVASCYRNQAKCQPCGPLRLIVRLYFPFVIYHN